MSKIPNKAQSLFGSKLLVAAIAIAGTGNLQASVIEEIVVTAQKREQNLQDVGVSVTAFTGDAMKELGMTESAGVAAQTPGLSYSSTGGLNTVFNIRGVSQNDFTVHQESPVTTYVDEGYISFTSAMMFANLDMERVEVLRGPQGTLFGRNATGGLLHFVTRKPSLEETEGNATVSLGENGLFGVDGGFGGPLSDTVAGRLAFSHTENDNYIDNLGTAADAGAAEEWAVRGTLLVQLTEDLRATLSIAVAEDENDSSVFHSEPSTLNAEGKTISTGPETGSTKIDTNDPNGWESEATNINLNVQYTTDSFTFTSVTTFLEQEALQLDDTDGQSEPVFGIPGSNIIELIDQDNEQFTQEFRLDGEFENGGTWVTGIYYMDREAFANWTIDYGTLFDDPDFGVNPGLYNDTYKAISDILLDTKSWAAFAQVEVPLTDTLGLTVGARHTDDDLEFRYAPVDYVNDVPFGTVYGPDWAVPASEREGGDDDWSGKVQLDWTPSNDVLVYAGVSRGIKGGGYNAPLFEGGAGLVADFGGEVLTSYEVGVKSTLLDGLRLNAAAYYYDYEGYQGFKFEGLNTIVVNNDAETQGLEVEMVASPADGLDIIFGLAYMDGEVTSGDDKGNEMPLSPELSFNLLVRQAWNLDDGSSVAVQLDGNWSDEKYIDTLNSPTGLIDAQHTINARLSWTSADESWSVALMAKNLTDEENKILPTPVGSLGYTLHSYERPRWVSAELNYNF